MTLEERRAYHRAYYHANKARLLPLKKASRERNREAIKAQRRRWEQSERGREKARLKRHRNRHQRAQYNREWAAANRQKVLEKSRRWRARNSEKVRMKNQQRRAKMSLIERKRIQLSRYKLSVDDYNALLQAQSGKCALCESTGTEYTRGRKKTPVRYSLAVDHCHKTGVVRGLLCHGCNTALGRFKDDPNVLRKALAYLERWSNQNGTKIHSPVHKCAA